MVRSSFDPLTGLDVGTGRDQQRRQMVPQMAADFADRLFESRKKIEVRRRDTSSRASCWNRRNAAACRDATTMPQVSRL
jgi:hypothetical protein